MNEYDITIEETLLKIVKVYALTYEDALDIVKGKYDKEEIVLDTTDYVETNIY